MSIAAVIAVVTAAGGLPEPSDASIVPFGVVVGGLFGGAVGRARRLPHEEVARLTAIGAFVLGWAAAICWIVAYLTTQLR